MADEMLDNVKLYSHYTSISLRAQLQYRMSFILQCLGHFLITALEFVGLAAVFQRFGTIKGWTLPEVGFLYGIIGVAFAIAEAIPRGFDVFAERYIRSGDFDRILLRPRGAAFQICAAELQLMRIGRFSQALVVLIISAAHLP